MASGTGLLWTSIFNSPHVAHISQEGSSSKTPESERVVVSVIRSPEHYQIRQGYLINEDAHFSPIGAQQPFPPLRDAGLAPDKTETENNTVCPKNLLPDMP